MALFFSEQINRVDRKGRVSVPAQFRAALGEALAEGVVAFPAFALDRQAVEVWPLARMSELQDSLDRLHDRFSDEQKNLASLMFAEARLLSFDDTGRVLLPRPLVDVAALDEEALFVGQGRTFQIWSPERYRPFKERLQARAAKGGSLATFPTAGRGGGE